MKTNTFYCLLVRFTVVSGVLFVAGCSTAPNGYGPSAQQMNEDAVMRQQVANQDPVANNRGMYLSMIREMQGNGLYFASLAHVNAFEQKYGSAPDVELLRAHGLREAGQSAESEAIYRALLSTSAGAAAAQGLGLLAGARGDFGPAVSALRDAAKRDPTNPLIVSDLGYALLRQGDIAAARLPIVQAAELAPANPKIIGNLALFLLVSGDMPRADAVMKKANLAPDTRAAVIKLAASITNGNRAPAIEEPAATVLPIEAAPVVAVATPAMARISESAPVAQEVRVVTEARRPLVSAVTASPVSGGPMQSLLDRFGSNTP
jgi:Flp pilus assembly protein TadD